MSGLNDSREIASGPRSLNVIVLDDNPEDAELSQRALKREYRDAHFDVITDEQQFVDRLRDGSADLILSDYARGKWTADDALKALKREGQDIPFILVTGTLEGEKAVQCVKNGMADFILKDRLHRLPLAVARALEEKRLRDNYRLAENSLRESETKFRALASALPAAILIEERDCFCYANRAAEDIMGYDQNDLLKLNFSRLVHRDSRSEFAELQAKRGIAASSSYRFEIMLQPKGGDARWIDAAVTPFLQNGMPATLMTAFDITQRKREHREIQCDPATGLPNRRHLGEVFDLEASRTRRTGRRFTVLLLHFHEINLINRKSGQLAASQALAHAARSIRRHCRNLDTVARITSDQFAMILPETDVEGASILGARIAARLGAAGSELALACRYGVGTHPSDGETLEDVLKVADRYKRSSVGA